MEKVAKTIKNHWDRIVQWKKSQINKGVLEGVNSIFQAAKRKARGYKAKHFKTIIYLITGGLDFPKLYSAYLPIIYVPDAPTPAMNMKTTDIPNSSAIT